MERTEQFDLELPEVGYVARDDGQFVNPRSSSNHRVLANGVGRAVHQPNPIAKRLRVHRDDIERVCHLREPFRQPGSCASVRTFGATGPEPCTMTRMVNRRSVLSVCCASLLLVPVVSRGQAGAAASTPTSEGTNTLYAIEIKVGPKWVASRSAHEQAFFREHSANLRTLRDQGSLVFGARYGDKGLVVLSAESEAAARALVEQDPSIKHGTFSYDLYEFSVFYGGTVQPVARKR